MLRSERGRKFHLEKCRKFQSSSQFHKYIYNCKNWIHSSPSFVLVSCQPFFFLIFFPVSHLSPSSVLFRLDHHLFVRCTEGGKNETDGLKVNKTRKEEWKEVEEIEAKMKEKNGRRLLKRRWRGEKKRK